MLDRKIALVTGGTRGAGRGVAVELGAAGATVYVTAGGKKQRGDIVSGGSYASTHDPRLHFGLGDATTIDSIEVHWPSGIVERFTALKPDQIMTLTEGKGTKP